MIQLPSGRPAAVAHIHGGNALPSISGTVSFFQVCGGTWVVAEVCGLPSGEGCGASHFFGFHIHEGGACTGPDFADTGSHFDPCHCPHPDHAGDLPPLLACHGRACLAVMTGRFCVSDVIGRTVVIHSDPDDFHSQPSGKSGTKIACGVICPT